MKSHTVRKLVLPLVFVLCQVAQAAAPILDGKWTLQELNGKPLVAAAAKSRPTITFKKGQVAFGAFLGVNTMSGSYVLKGPRIQFKRGPQTLIGATQELIDLEHDYSIALGEATKYRLTPTTLELLKGAKVILNFKK